jgi:hypothetical protein
MALVMKSIAPMAPHIAFVSPCVHTKQAAISCYP